MDTGGIETNPRTLKHFINAISTVTGPILSTPLSGLNVVLSSSLLPYVVWLEKRGGEVDKKKIEKEILVTCE